MSRGEFLSAKIIERFSRVPVANVSDVMDRMAAGGPRIRPFHKKGVLVGPAVTVKTRPGDNLMIHKALDIAQKGDVIVVDGGGDLTNALIGDLIVDYAKTRGIAGIVINGAVRDLGTIREGQFPVFAAGVTHRGPYKDGPGDVNIAIAIDGMVIRPGDIILGDDDGFVCIPHERAHEILGAAEKKQQAEEQDREAILNGTYKREWVDERIKLLGLSAPVAKS